MKMLSQRLFAVFILTIRQKGRLASGKKRILLLLGRSNHNHNIVNVKRLSKIQSRGAVLVGFEATRTY